MKITTIGIDLAKEVFQIHGVNEHGKIVVRKQVKRKDMASYCAVVRNGYLPGREVLTSSPA